MATEHAASTRTNDTLNEIMHRLIPIHAALAERTLGDVDFQRWMLRRLMETIEYVEDAKNAKPTKA